MQFFSGRVDQDSSGGVTLIGSASFVSFRFKGDSCAIYLKNDTPGGLQNYIALELDGEYLGRLRIEGNFMQEYPVEIKINTSEHTLTIYKSTEAANGSIVFGGIMCDLLLNAPKLPEKSIEFIGNSITCGMGVDLEEIPCDTDQWYDQHNAYLAYGPVVSRRLNTRFT